jgi:hypothetical protein
VSSVAPDGAGEGPHETSPTEDPARSATQPATVVVRFRPELISTWLRTGTAPALLTQLGDVLAAYGFRLTQTHQGTDDDDLASWFSFDAPELDARRALALLQRHPAVEAAYTKPPAAPPG